MRQIYRVTIVLLALLLLSSCGVDVPLAEPIVPTLQPTASMPTPTLASSVPIVTGVTAAGAVDVNTPVPPIIVVVEPEVIPTEPVVEPPTPVTMQLHQQILSEDLLTWIIEQRQAGQTLEQVASELAAVDLLFDVDANHLHTNGAKAYSEVDSSGNGVPFWAISLYRLNNTENNLAELWLIGENNLEISFSLARQIAGFRLLMLAGGWERSWLDYLLERYPGEPVTMAAELYLQSREDRLSDETACGLVTEFLLGQENPLGQFDGWLGYGNPDIDAENLCQPAPERNQEAQRPLLWQDAQPAGNETVDLVVAAVLNHDGLALGNLAQIIERPCTFEDGLVMLRCEDDEEAGDLIATLLMGHCEGYYFRVSDAEPLDLTSFLDSVIGLYGVATDMHSGGFAITFATDEIIGDMTLIGDENGVHSFIWFGCATVGTRLLQNAPGGVMLAPREPTGRSLRGY